MAIEQPMGVGVTEMFKGIGSKTTERVAAEAVLKATAEWHHSLNEAAVLLKELQDSPAYRDVYRELDKEITTLMNNSERCVAYLNIVHGWRRILDAPRVAEIKLMQLMGPDLSSISRETQAAP